MITSRLEGKPTEKNVLRKREVSRGYTVHAQRLRRSLSSLAVGQQVPDYPGSSEITMGELSATKAICLTMEAGLLNRILMELEKRVKM